jgi:tRNA(fMet)-specific endonuclease VapC
LIAAIARTHDAVLVTHNTNEFSRVTNLRLADWETETQ